MKNHPSKGRGHGHIRGHGHMTRFLNFATNHIFGVIGEAKHFKFRALIDTQEY